MDKYSAALERHYQLFYRTPGESVIPKGAIGTGFRVMEIPPNNRRRKIWTYLTIGLSKVLKTEQPMELFLYTPIQSPSIANLFFNAIQQANERKTFHLDDCISFNQPWMDHSKCESGLISLPYLEGEGLEIFNFRGVITHCYWLIPITNEELTYRNEFGVEALEQIFEEKKVDYTNVGRGSLV